MFLSPTNLNIFFTALETRYWTAYTLAPTWNEKLCTTYPCNTETFLSGWIGQLQKMRQWNGSRKARWAAPQTYSVAMQTFELTYAADAFILKSDGYGIYSPIVAMMGQEIKKNRDYQVRDMLQNQNAQTGSQQLCFDGLSYFNTAHPIDNYDASKGTYCTDFRGGGVSIGGITVGGALNTIGFATLYQEFSSRKGESGEALGIFPNMLQCPSQLSATARQIINSTFFSPSAISGLSGHETFVGATDNPLKGMVDIEVTADLNSQPQQWYLWDTTKPIKPIGVAVNTPANFVYRVSPEDPVVFNEHQYLYGSYERFVPLWGFPWMGAISSN